MHHIKYHKGFKYIVGILSIGWLSILTANIISTDSLHTSVFDADGNPTEQVFVLTDADYAKIAQLKSTWSEEDTKSNAKVRAEKAVRAYNNGDFENAVALYNEALALGGFEEQNSTTIFMNLALAYEALHDSTNATRTYRIIQNNSPKSVFFNVAEAKIALLGEYINVKKAIIALNNAIKLEPNNFEANNALALIYMGEYGNEFKDLKTALTYNTRMVQISPENINIRINLAITNIELGKLSDAKTQLDFILAKQPSSIPANYLMMKTLNLLGDATEAKAYANKLIAWYSDFQNDKLVAEIIGNK
ncbi:MAG: hypothetical protein Q8P68_01300 [Candidatus Peregrinibacteria bacterium]|nr:hypothetical protein [Candidatus Peregrinibacteria bacterium]MDZ4245357.1 hypothetical protein [Candidatus Gracilibacteria bacterium]